MPVRMSINFTSQIPVGDSTFLKGKGGLQKPDKLFFHQFVLRYSAAVKLKASPVIIAAIGKLEHHEQIVEEKGKKPRLNVPAQCAAAASLGN